MQLAYNEETTLVIDDIYCKYYITDWNKPLVIAFASAGSLVDEKHIKENGSPWGYDFIKNRGYNTICFSATITNTWYRSALFYEFSQKLSTLIKVFPIRLGYGSCMGGYGVSAYSNILGIDRLLLFNPVSTLNMKLVPWEKRYNRANKLNWHSGVFDGATTLSKGFVIYDPLFNFDAMHAKRFKSLVHLKVPGVGHSIPQHVNSLGLLKWVFDSFVEESLSPKEFHAAVKKRRTLPRYYNWLLSEENTHLTEKRKEVILKYQKINIYKNIVTIDLDKKSFVVLRDSALLLETIDIEKAYQLMLIAHKLLPDGELVNKKLIEYKKIIEKKTQEKKHVL